MTSPEEQPPARVDLDRPAPRWTSWAYRRTVQREGLRRFLGRRIVRRRPGSYLRKRVLASVCQYNARSYSDGDIEALLASFHPDVVLHNDPQFMTLGMRERYDGHEGIRAFTADWLSVWSSFEMDVHELLDYGDAMLMSYTITATGSASGAEMQQGFWMVLRQDRDDGRANYQAMFGTLEDAREHAEALRQTPA